MKAIQIRDIAEAVSGTLAWGQEEAFVHHVSTDSRDVKDGTLFVPIIGERVDAHRFIPEVLAQGAVCVFSSDHTVQGDTGACIYVEDTLAAMQRLATWYRSLFTVPVIGITGSVGKTTTKEMIAAVLETKYKTLKTYKNLNSQIGVALMMFELEEDTEIAVIEMGISMPGEMNRLVDMVKPECAVLTNIGVSHIGNLGSRENICAEKGKILTYIPEGGQFYVCGNGDMKELTRNHLPCGKRGNNPDPVYYGTERDCLYYGDHMHTGGEGQCFTFHDPKGQEEVELSVMGQHNVNNAVVALALARQYDVPMPEALRALKEYRPIDKRGVIHHVNGVHLIDDSYNASPDSITSNLRALFDYPGDGRRIAVLADVLELGENSGELHEGMGRFIVEESKKGRELAHLITVGTEASRIGSVVEKGCEIPVVCCDSREEAVRVLKECIQEDDWILVKGSRGMQMDQVVEQCLQM